jgi:hypothetical protein
MILRRNSTYASALPAAGRGGIEAEEKDKRLVKGTFP